MTLCRLLLGGRLRRLLVQRLGAAGERGVLGRRLRRCGLDRVGLAGAGLDRGRGLLRRAL